MKNEDKPESNERYYKFFINLLDLFGVPQKLLCGFLKFMSFSFNLSFILGSIVP